MHNDTKAFAMTRRRANPTGPDRVTAPESDTSPANIYREIFMNAVEGIYRSTVDGRFIEVNPALARMFGCGDVAEFMATYRDIPRDFYVDRDVRNRFTSAVATEGWLTGFESLGRRKDGSTFWFSETARVRHDAAGHVVGFEGFIQDISERKRAEERYRLAMQGTNEGLWEWSADDPARYFLSKRAQAAAGVTLEGNTVDAEWWRHRIHPEDRPEHDALLAQVFETPGLTWCCEYRFLSDDGRYRWVLDRGAQARDATGRVTRIAGSLGDITDRREAEAALRTAYSQLEDAKVRAEAANRAKSEFLANMNHELRTPLNAVLGFGQILRDEQMGRHAIPSYRDYAADICNSASHLHDIINDLLDLAKIEAGRLELMLEPLDPTEVAKTSLRLMTPRSTEAGVALQLDIADDLPPIVADHQRIKQVLVNLLSNAVKFSPAETTTRVVLSGEQGNAVLRVIDGGIGMAQDEIALALEPFQQLDRGRARRQGGTGLGLPLSRHLVEQHGGSLHIASALDAGTTVTVRLPPQPPGSDEAGPVTV